MKTFETEKSDIPEGATHHGIYGCDTDVYFKEDNGVFLQWHHENWSLSQFANHKWVKPIPQTNIETPEEKEALDLIDTTPRQYESVASKEVEWVNGELLEFNGELLEFNGEPCIFIGMSEGFPVVKYTNDADSTLAGEIDEIFATDMLSKPETEAERVERERLEAAEDLYITYMSKWEFAQDWRALDEINKSAFLAIVDKTNYRKESE